MLEAAIELCEQCRAAWEASPERAAFKVMADQPTTKAGPSLNKALASVVAKWADARRSTDVHGFTPAAREMDTPIALELTPAARELLEEEDGGELGRARMQLRRYEADIRLLKEQLEDERRRAEHWKEIAEMHRARSA